MCRLSFMLELSYSLSSAKRGDMYSLIKNVKMLHLSKRVVRNTKRRITDRVLLTKHSRDCF